jgi:hypothetical protein
MLQAGMPAPNDDGIGQQGVHCMVNSICVVWCGVPVACAVYVYIRILCAVQAGEPAADDVGLPWFLKCRVGCRATLTCATRNVGPIYAWEYPEHCKALWHRLGRPSASGLLKSLVVRNQTLAKSESCQSIDRSIDQTLISNQRRFVDSPTVCSCRMVWTVLSRSTRRRTCAHCTGTCNMRWHWCDYQCDNAIALNGARHATSRATWHVPRGNL